MLQCTIYLNDFIFQNHIEDGTDGAPLISFYSLANLTVDTCNLSENDGDYLIELF